MAGLPKKYAKMGFKKGWAAYRKAHPKSRSKSPSSKPKGGKPSVSRKRGFTPQKAFKFIRLGALALPAVEVLTSQDSMQNKLVRLGKKYMAYDATTGQVHLEWLLSGYGPYLGSILATYGIPKIAGIIRGI